MNDKVTNNTGLGMSCKLQGSFKKYLVVAPHCVGYAYIIMILPEYLWKCDLSLYIMDDNKL